MNKNTLISDNLLVRHSLDDITLEEKQRVENWIALSDENHIHYNRVVTLWSAAEGIADFEAIDLAENWKAIQAKITQQSPQTKKTTPLPLRMSTLWKIAAAAVLLLSLGGYFIFNASLDTIIVDANHLQGGEYRLPDGSKVWLRGTSTIAYTSEYGKNERRVELHGEGYFEIEKNDQIPFIAESNNATTKVLGTSFNLKDNRKSNTTALILVSGSVNFSTSKEQLVIAPGELVFANLAEKLIKTKNRDLNFMSWKTGLLTFKDTEMKEVIKDIASFYDIKIKIERRSFSVCTLTSTFDNVPLEELFETLEILFGIEIVKNEQSEYILKGKGC